MEGAGFCGTPPFVIYMQKGCVCKMERQIQKKLMSAMECPVTAFAVGTLCGLTMGLMLLPWVKGIVIGSYNKAMPGKPPKGCQKDAHSCCHEQEKTEE